MNPVRRPIPTRTRALAAGAPLAALVLLLAACGSDATATSTETTAAPADAQGQMPEGAFGGGGTSGEIVLVDGTTMQVQSSDSQTSVTWDDSTTFTQAVEASLDDVQVDVCVTAVTGTDGSAATSVAISDPVDGECTGTSGFGGFGGGTPGEMPTDMPQGDMPEGGPTDAPDGEMPDGAPTGMPEGEMPDGGGFGGGGAGTTGMVTAVDGSTISVQVSSQDGSTSTAQITVDDATTWTRTVETDASAAVVGLCASVQGQADDSGEVAATSVAVTDPTDDGCTTATGRGGAGQRPGAAEDGSDA